MDMIMVVDGCHCLLVKLCYHVMSSLTKHKTILTIYYFSKHTVKANRHCQHARHDVFVLSINVTTQDSNVNLESYYYTIRKIPCGV